jgi:sulfur relay (sulfurtransferase) DsrF/TusC family protein
MKQKTLIIIRKPPFGSVDSWEGLRCSLSFYASGMPVEILLEGAGVFNWLKGITPESIDPQSVSRFSTDIEKFQLPVFIVEEDLAKFGLNQDDLVSSHPKVISRKDAALLMADHETTIAV